MDRKAQSYHERLEAWRWRNRLTKTEMGAKVGIQRGHMTGILNGGATPGHDLADRLKKLTGVKFVATSASKPLASRPKRPQRERREAAA